jgi:hypothetical protein
MELKFEATANNSKSFKPEEFETLLFPRGCFLFRASVETELFQDHSSSVMLVPP